MRTALLTLLSAAAGAFAQDVTFRATVPVVLVPVTVTDGKGRYVDGLGVTDFELLDNGLRRQIQLDTAESISAPVALVVAVQANDISATALLKIRKTGSMIQPLITGERGRAAILTYGEKLHMVQDFTGDAQKIIEGFQNFRPEDSRSAHLLDAVSEAAQMLGRRPKGERRILLVIGESKDRGSESNLSDVILSLQRLGITAFPSTYSPWKTPFTTKASELPPPSGASMDLLAGLSELVRLGKVNAAEVLARESGGRVLSFATLHALEHVLTHVGEEIHSQYLISAPAMTEPQGFHKIEVSVRTRPGTQIHARPGYWVVP